MLYEVITATATATFSPFPFTKDLASPQYLQNFANSAGCNWMGVAGARTVTQAAWVRELKRSSGIWIKQRDPRMKSFAWQSGYGAFSVSASALARTRDYIANQAIHHATRTRNNFV